jgi:DNA-binding phage protein
VAKSAGIPNSGTIRDIEAGRDAKLSNVEAIAKVLGLELSLQETAESAS